MLLQPDAGMVGEKPGWLAKSQWPSCGYLRARRSVRTARSISAAPATPLRRPSGSRCPEWSSSTSFATPGWTAATGPEQAALGLTVSPFAWPRLLVVHLLLTLPLSLLATSGLLLVRRRRPV